MEPGAHGTGMTGMVNREAAGLQIVARLSRTTGVGAAHDALRRKTPWGSL
jgi:hypothetical protein